MTRGEDMGTKVGREEKKGPETGNEDKGWRQ